MRKLGLFVLILCSCVGWAKDKPWQDAQVVALSPDSNYWIQGTVDTYILKSSKIRLTLGGQVKAYSDGKNLHLIDNEGKERKCLIVREMVNATANEMMARERAKTPEQRAAEQAQRDAFRLQQQALRQQAIRDYQAAHTKQKVEVEVKDCTKYPALCVD